MVSYCPCGQIILYFMCDYMPNLVVTFCVLYLKPKTKKQKKRKKKSGLPPGSQSWLNSPLSQTKWQEAGWLLSTLVAECTINYGRLTSLPQWLWRLSTTYFHCSALVSECRKALGTEYCDCVLSILTYTVVFYILGLGRSLQDST